MRRIACLAAILLLSSMASAQRRDRDGRSWRVQDQETIQRSFEVSASSSPRKLLVDNISGYIHVSGYGGRAIQVNVNKRIGADSNEALAEARRDVKLDLSQQGNYVRLYVDGPFRSPNGINYRGEDYYGYRVIFDYDIQVPFETELLLKTINYGEIEVKKTSGDFEINGVNGAIEMDEISGSGTVRTVNGPLKVGFSRNPSKNSEFRNVNGTMDVYFQPGLNADLNFRTVNGGVYSDFDIVTRPLPVAAGDRVNGRFVYRSDRTMNARTGSGGPELTFHTVNGAIRLRSKAF